MPDNTFASSPPDGVWDELNKSAGTRVKRLRTAAGLTPSDLMHRFADRGIKLHPTQIGRIETGERVLRLDEAQAVALIFGIEMSDLVEGTDDLEFAALELQQRDALSALTFRREMFARFNRVFAEVGRELTKINEEIEHYQAVVYETEQRMADIRDGETDADSDNGFEEA